MKISLKHQPGILSLPNDFATLDKITNDFFVYNIKYSINAGSAVKNEAYNVVITVSSAAPIKNTKSNFVTTNPNELINNILLKSAQSKDLIRTFADNVILTVKSDVSAKIPNDSLRMLNADSGNKSVGTKNEIRLAPVGDLNSKNISMPILQTSIAVPSALIVSQKEIQTSSHDLIFYDGMDPANIAIPTNFIISSKKIINGFSPNITTAKDQTKQSQSLINSVIKSGTSSKTTTQDSLVSKDMIPVIVKIPKTFIEVTKQINVPKKSILNEEFYLILDLRDKDDLTVETLNSVVAHGKNVSTIKIPVIPPAVLLTPSSKVGKTTLSIKQNDPYAIGVNIYRKTINKHQPQIDAFYSFIGNLSLTTKDGFKKFVVIHPNFNPTIFRVIPYNESNILSSEFTSLISQADNLPFNVKKSREEKIGFVSLFYQFREHGINIEVSNIPSGPILINILRADLTVYQKTPKLVGTILLNNAGITTKTIIDTAVVPGHVYEYTCKLLYKNGKIQSTATNLIVEYIQTTNNIINTELSIPTISNLESGLDVNFTIKSTLIDSKFDLIKKALTDQGLSVAFQDDIINNKEKLQNLFGYNIIRTNLTTGEIEDFGIMIDKTFSDINHGKLNAVSPLKSGFDYRYNIRTYFRSPETLFETYKKTITDQNNISYTMKPSKWLHPITLTKGNIGSKDSFKTNYAKNDFSHGLVGSNEFLNVSLANILPSILNSKASKLNEKLVSIQWKVQGEISKIDHFIIILEILGMRTIVGKCHNTFNGNTCQFIDSLDDGEHGALTYHIIPVFYDYSRGTELTTNQVVI